MATDYITSDGKTFSDSNNSMASHQAREHQAKLDGSGSSSSVSGSGRIINASHDSGQKAFNEGRYNDAIEECTEVINCKSSRALAIAVAYLNRGAAYFKKGEYDKAIADDKEAIRLLEDSVVTFYATDGVNDCLEQAKKNLANVEQAKASDLVNQGLAAHKAGEYAKAVELFRKAADMGNGWAMNNLGVCYRDGTGVPKDMNKAAEWFEKAANNGHAGSMNGLGYCYLNGNGKTKDQAKAVEWFRKAIDAGNNAAMCSLGECYRDGTGVKQDFAEAEKWINKSIANGGGEAEKAELAKLKKMRGY